MAPLSCEELRCCRTSVLRMFPSMLSWMPAHPSSPVQGLLLLGRVFLSDNHVLLGYFRVGGGILRLASVTIPGVRSYYCTESVHSSSSSVCRAFWGRFLVPLPIWKLIPINLSLLTNRKNPANTDACGTMLKMPHEVFNLVFHAG